MDMIYLENLYNDLLDIARVQLFSGSEQEDTVQRMFRLAAYRHLYVLDLDNDLEKFNVDISYNTDSLSDLELFEILELFETCSMRLQMDYDHLFTVLYARVQDTENRLDNIDAIRAIKLLNINDKSRDLLIEEACLILESIDYRQYLLVEDPVYTRKIHHSYHYPSPLTLLYVMNSLRDNCKSNKLIEVLERSWKKLMHFFDKMNVAEASLFIISTPEACSGMIDIITEEYIQKIMDNEKFDKIPLYYDAKISHDFLKSSLYVTSLCAQGIKKILSVHSQNISDSLPSTYQHKDKGEQFFQCISQRLKVPEKYKMMKLEGSCMEPYLKNGEYLNIEYNLENIKREDVIVFRCNNNKIMAHRVINVIERDNEKIYITSADNGGLWGYPVFKRDIVGKVIN